MQKKNTLVWTRDGLVNNFFLNMWRNNSGFSNWVESYAASSEIAITFAVVVTCWTQSIGILFLLVADRHKKLSCCNKLPNDEINMNGKLNNPWLSNSSSVYFFNIVDRQRSIYVTVIASIFYKEKQTNIDSSFSILFGVAYTLHLLKSLDIFVQVLRYLQIMIVVWHNRDKCGLVC